VRFDPLASKFTLSKNLNQENLSEKEKQEEGRSLRRLFFEIYYLIRGINKIFGGYHARKKKMPHLRL
jgi:hypothetical protein